MLYQLATWSSIETVSLFVNAQLEIMWKQVVAYLRIHPSTKGTPWSTSVASVASGTRFYPGPTAYELEVLTTRLGSWGPEFAPGVCVCVCVCVTHTQRLLPSLQCSSAFCTLPKNKGKAILFQLRSAFTEVLYLAFTVTLPVLESVVWSFCPHRHSPFQRSTGSNSV
jgi:hypothetical protein